MPLLEELLNLLLPSKCIGCNVTGEVICQECQFAFNRTSRSAHRNQISGIAACEYVDSAVQVVHEFKTRQQTSLASFMAREIIGAAKKQNIYFETGDRLVPMPSSQHSFGVRGFNPAKLIADQIALEVFRTNKKILTTFDCLALTKFTADQASLDAAGRTGNLANSMAVAKASHLTGMRKGRVWLVDDIVTTGATLTEAARALSQHSTEIAGFLVFAETTRRFVSGNSV